MHKPAKMNLSLQQGMQRQQKAHNFVCKDLQTIVPSKEGLVTKDRCKQLRLRGLFAQLKSPKHKVEGVIL